MFPNTVLNPTFPHKPYDWQHLLREHVGTLNVAFLIRSTKDARYDHKQITVPWITEGVPYCRAMASKAFVQACSPLLHT